jgi:hypothetical protein
VFGVPAARFVHLGGQTMNRMPARRVELLYAKRALFFLKHGGIRSKRLFVIALWLASLTKLAGWILLLPFRPERARSEIPLHLHMLRRAPRL